MKTHDVSADEKTGDALYDLVSKDIRWSEDTYGIAVVGVCSDDGGDAKKMRRLVREKMHWLIVVLCWAHQINLIVGDYLGLQSEIVQCIFGAQEIVQWMNNHSRALGIFRREQLQTYAVILALIRPVITRWTAHYLSLRRLLKLRIPLETSWIKYGNEMIQSAGPKQEAKRKAESIRDLIGSKVFWSRVTM